MKYTIRRNFEVQNWDEGTENKDPSMVQPEHALETEINNVMARYARTGQMPLPEVAPVFADLSVDFDFGAAHDKIIEARRLFLDLPVKVKDEFRTAEGLLDAFADESKHYKLFQLGILQKPSQDSQEPPEAAPVPSVESPKANKKGSQEPSAS